MELSLRLIGHLRLLDCAHVRIGHHFHLSMPHDIYALCVASDLCITCSYDMLGSNNVISSHMPCTYDCHMLYLIASHMMTNSSFYCVECHTIFTTTYAHYAWIVLPHAFRHFVFYGVVNDSYAYHRPLLSALCMLPMNLR